MINRDQYTELLATQLSIIQSLKELSSDDDCDFSREIYTHRELVLQYNPVFVSLSRNGIEALHCVQFDNHEELDQLQGICNYSISFPGIERDTNIIVVELYDEYHSKWYCLNYDEFSIFDTRPVLSDQIKRKKFSPVSYEHCLKYFIKSVNYAAIDTES